MKLTGILTALILCTALLLLPGRAFGTCTAPVEIIGWQPNLSYAASTGTVTFTAGDLTCQDWTASTSASWITLTSATSGAGNGSVSFAVSENISAEFRYGWIDINDASFWISQDPAHYTFSLSGGWNFISLPLQPADDKIENVLGQLYPTEYYGLVAVVWGYDNKNKMWLRYKPQSTNNTLLTMEPHKGYWVYIYGDGRPLDVWGKKPASLRGVYPGWNLIGTGGNDTLTLSSLSDIFSPQWSLLWNWEKGSWRFEGRGIQAGFLPSIGTLVAGKAYWLKVPSASSQTVGTEGGSITSGDFSLVIPQGALSQSITVELLPVANSDPAQAASGSAYQVTGIPAEFSKPLTLKIRPQSGYTEGMYLRIGVAAYDYAAGGETIRYTGATTTFEDGYLVARIPPLASQAPAAAPGRRAPMASRDYMTTPRVVLEARKSESAPREVCEGGHFLVVWPSPADTFPRPINVCQELNKAYDVLVTTLGFSVAKRTDWPMTVRVRDLGPELFGQHNSSNFTVNWDELDINSQLMTVKNADAIRETIIHEMFHFVQGLYTVDPRIRLADPRYWIDPAIWLDEAASVWAQRFTSANPGTYIPGDFTRNLSESITVPTKPITSVRSPALYKAIQNHGYGMPSLLEYFRKYHDPSGRFILRVFEQVNIGARPAQAIINAIYNLDRTLPARWWSGYLYQYLTGGTYPWTETFKPGVIGLNVDAYSVDLSSLAPYTRAVDLPHLSARFFRISARGTLLKPDHKLHITLKDDTTYGKFRIFKISTTTNPGRPRIITAIQPYDPDPEWAEHTELVIDNPTSVLSDSQELLVVVYNTDFQSPEDDTALDTFTLNVFFEGVTQCELRVQTYGNIMYSHNDNDDVIWSGNIPVQYYGADHTPPPAPDVVAAWGYDPYLATGFIEANGTFLAQNVVEGDDLSTPPVKIKIVDQLLTFTLNATGDRVVSYEGKEELWSPGGDSYGGCLPACNYDRHYAIKGESLPNGGIPRRTDLESPYYPRVYYAGGADACNYITSLRWEHLSHDYQSLEIIKTYNCNQESYVQIRCGAPDFTFPAPSP